MAGVDIFCEISFLTEFAKNCSWSGAKTQFNEQKNWNNYFEFFSNNKLVIVDIDKNDFIERCNEETIEGQIFQELLIGSFDTGGIHCEPDKGKYLQKYESTNDELNYFCAHDNSVFFLNRNKLQCDKLEKDYGLFFFSMENIHDRADLLFAPKRIVIDENIKDWSFVSKYQHPCTSITLIDNYILSKTREEITLNLLSLFDALLPKELNKAKFKITIATEVPQKITETHADEKFNDLKARLIKLRLNYSLEIHFVKIRNGNHDRNIYTNYFLYDSGYGFVLTNSERKKGTKLTVFSITHSSTLVVIDNLKNRLKKFEC